MNGFSVEKHTSKQEKEAPGTLFINHPVYNMGFPGMSSVCLDAEANERTAKSKGKERKGKCKKTNAKNGKTDALRSIVLNREKTVPAVVIVIIIIIIEMVYLFR